MIIFGGLLRLNKRARSGREWNTLTTEEARGLKLGKEGARFVVPRPVDPRSSSASKKGSSSSV